MPTLYKHRDLRRLFPDIKDRTMINWVEHGLVTPEIEADGKGTHRQYTFEQVAEIFIVSEMVGLGLPYKLIKKMLKPMKSKDGVYKGWSSIDSKNKIVFIEATKYHAMKTIAKRITGL